METPDIIGIIIGGILGIIFLLAALVSFTTQEKQFQDTQEEAIKDLRNLLTPQEYDFFLIDTHEYTRTISGNGKIKDNEYMQTLMDIQQQIKQDFIQYDKKKQKEAINERRYKEMREKINTKLQSPNAYKP